MARADVDPRAVEPPRVVDVEGVTFYLDAQHNAQLAGPTMLANLRDVALTAPTGATGPTGPAHGSTLLYDAPSAVWRDGVAGSGGVDEVWQGPTPPTDPATELWVDTSVP